MVFKEKKIEEGYEYTTEQFVGEFKFTTDQKLTANILDNLVLALHSSPSIEEDIEFRGIKINIKFKKNPLWEEDKEESVEGDV